ncbi:hypothetical protein FQZ97_623150 [compost metagenome]
MLLLSNSQPGWFGLTITSASGSSGPGRWWSVTSTCRPRALAAATPSTLAMPLSTVISMSAPALATRSAMGGVRP